MPALVTSRESVTTRDWEGRDTFRRTAGLVLLEAARRLGVRLQLGPSITSGRLVVLPGQVDRAALVRALNAGLSELHAAAAPIHEVRSIDDAVALLRKQEDESACLLLEDSLESAVTLLRCGETWAHVTHVLESRGAPRMTVPSKKERDGERTCRAARLNLPARAVLSVCTESSRHVVE